MKRWKISITMCALMVIAVVCLGYSEYLEGTTLMDAAYIKGTLTAVGNFVTSGTADADSYTCDAGAGLDNQAAGALLLGAATATSVEIADSGVLTDIQGTLSVDEAATLDSTLAVTGATTLSNDITLAAASGNNSAGARNQIQGLIKMHVVQFGTMTDASAETVSYMDDSPDGEWTQVSVSTPPTISGDAAIYKDTANSLKLAWLDAAADGDGAEIDITDDNLEGNESIGFWLYSNTTFSSGDFELMIDDTSVDTAFNFPAYAAKNTWQWVEIDISSLAGGTGDIVDKIQVLISAAGATALGGLDMYIDGMWKWDADDEEAIGYNIVTDGVVDAWYVATAAGSANTPAALTYLTNYFVHYESGSDFIVGITDNSTYSGSALVLYQ